MTERVTSQEHGKLGIFLDTETTGLCPHRHRTVEIAMKIVDLATGEVKCAFESIVKQPAEVWSRSDPNALKVNGFSADSTEEGETESVVARHIKDIFLTMNVSRRNAFFICQNPSLDRNFFGQLIAEEQQKQQQWPYHWLDFVSMNWALCMKDGIGWESQTPLSKDCIASAHGLPPEDEPHRAMNGVDHLVLLYQKVVGFPSPPSPNENHPSRSATHSQMDLTLQPHAQQPNSSQPARLPT